MRLHLVLFLATILSAGTFASPALSGTKSTTGVVAKKPASGAVASKPKPVPATVPKSAARPSTKKPVKPAVAKKPKTVGAKSGGKTPVATRPTQKKPAGKAPATKKPAGKSSAIKKPLGKKPLTAQPVKPVGKKPKTPAGTKPAATGSAGKTPGKTVAPKTGSPTSGASCPLRKSSAAKGKGKVAGTTSTPKKISSREHFLARRKLASEFNGGVKNICKEQFAALPEIVAQSLRGGGNPCASGKNTEFYDYNDGDTVVTVAPFPKLATGEKLAAKSIELGLHCEHVLELNIVQRVIEAPGGLCEAVAKKFASATVLKALGDCATEEDQRAAITKRDKDVATVLTQPLRVAINSLDNLVLTQANLLEAQKAEVVKRTFDSSVSLDIVTETEIDDGEPLPPTALTAEQKATIRANQPNRLKAANNYLELTSNGQNAISGRKLNTIAVAKAVDQVITDAFTKLGETRASTAPTVTSEWNKVLSKAKALAV